MNNEEKKLNEQQETYQEEAKTQLVPTTNEVSSLEMISKKLHQSGLFTHLKNPYQALAVVEYGRELGVPPMAALQTMAVINGRICVEAKLMLAQFQKNGGVIEVLERNKNICRIRFTFGKNVQEVSFSIEDAKRIGLTNKDNWVKYPEEMLFWRCIAKGVRSTAPGVMMGAYTIEEMTEGEAVDIEQLQQKIDNIEPQPETQPTTESTIEPYTVDNENNESTKPIEPKKITVKQRNLIYLRASEAKVTDEQLHEYIKKNFNKDSVKDLNNEEMDKLLQDLEKTKQEYKKLRQRFDELVNQLSDKDKEQVLELIKKFNKKIKTLNGVGLLDIKQLKEIVKTILEVNKDGSDDIRGTKNTNN